MKLSGQYRIPATRDRVFAALCDPDVLLRCIPVLETIDRHSPTDYAARVRATVGPLKARFSGHLRLLPIDAPRFYILHAEGGGGLAGAVKGEAQITLEEIDGGHTELSFTLSAALGGAVGRLAIRLVKDKADRVIARFFDRFTADLLGLPLNDEPEEHRPPPEATR